MAGHQDPDLRIELRAGVRIAPADSGRWQVRWDFDEVTFLEGEAWGRVLPWLLPALDRPNTARSIEELAVQHAVSGELEEVLRCLSEQGFLAIAGTAMQSAGLARTRITVLGRSRLAEITARSIAEQGFADVRLEKLATGWLDPSSSASADVRAFPVVIETDFHPHDLAGMNVAAIAAGHPWMLLAAWNRCVLVGPIFVPGETACHECYRTRLDSHRRHLAASRASDAWLDREPQAPPPEPVLPAVAELAAAWAALEVSRYATDAAAARIVGRVLVYQPEEARLSIENVLRIPWCLRCAAAQRREGVA